MPRLKLHTQIFIAVLLAVGVGLVAGPDAALFGLRLHDVLDFVGSLFLRALKMVVVPLIAASIITGMAGVGGKGGLGRLGGKTALFYATTSLLAILVGLLMVQLVSPGLVDGRPARALVGLSEDAGAVAQQVSQRGARDVVEVLLRAVPENVVDSAARGDMLGLIVFSLVFGYFATRLPAPKARVVREFWESIFDVMLLITDAVLKLAPIGVFALVGRVVMATGFGAFRPLGAFFVTVIAALALHLFVVLPLLLSVVGRVNPILHFRAMAPALLMGFSTASSSATLPLTLECVERRAGVSNRVTSFVVPLGATINMDGTALYECVAALFIAQAYGLTLSFAQQFTVVAVALLTSIGVAGIPAASLVAITIILAAIGLPAEAVGMILAVDRILDMCRTSVNLFSDSCGAVIIGRSEGETEILTRPPDAQAR